MTDTFRLKSDAKVSTNWATIGSVIAATAIVVGGLFSVKADIAEASKSAKEARTMVEEIRNDLLNLRISLGNFSSVTPPRKSTP